MKKIISILLICILTCMASITVNANNTTSYIVNCSALNVRSEPSLQGAIIGSLYRGSQITGGQSSNGWTPIVYNGKNAFVYSAYLTTQSNTSTSTNTNTGNLTYIGTYRTTGYDICYSCCGKIDGITASGTKATPGRTVAMKGYPYGTKIYIEGVGYRTVEDTGGFHTNTIDILCNNHSECYAITGYKKVYLVQ